MEPVYMTSAALQSHTEGEIEHYVLLEYSFDMEEVEEEEDWALSCPSSCL